MSGPPRQISLRTSLIMLVLACVLPGIALCSYLLYANYQLEKEKMAQQTELLASQILVELDRELAVIESGLHVLATSELAFNLIKWFGVAYLVYLGWKQWVAVPGEIAAGEGERPLGRPLTLVLRGFLVNASNPKALVFMLAVLPQFVNPNEPLVSQYLTLGVTMIAVELIVMAGYTGLASKVLRLLRTPKQQRRLNRTFAGLFVGAAGFLATLHRATT